jgi:Bacterial regulatory helix-turn-helix protein, lysR family
LFLSPALASGKAALLESIRDTGSISAAAREMGMSYKRAWLLLDSINQAFTKPVVTLLTREGPRNTDQARRFPCWLLPRLVCVPRLARRRHQPVAILGCGRFSDCRYARPKG